MFLYTAAEMTRPTDRPSNHRTLEAGRTAVTHSHVTEPMHNKFWHRGTPAENTRAFLDIIELRVHWGICK